MLIECVPNVSEGRRPEVIADLADAIRQVQGVRLLDYSSDGSHNRSVFTFVGDAAGVGLAAVSLVERALAAIDLRTHRGEHPRLGAVDVIPFIPLEGAGMADCVTLAKQVGASLAERFALPVYLYEEAAADPTRARLEDIRRGGFEGLQARMADPHWAPDFGPSTPHPSAGATIIGARFPLIAFNVNLATDRIDVARRIAVAIRSSSGGLPHLKAIGVRLAERGIVQVSMNLTNYTVTSLSEAFEAVKTEAARDGVRVLESEIIGLVPAAALVDAASAHLRLAGFGPTQVLEQRLLGR